MTDEHGTLSIDFLAGFTIFMISFIWVVSMIPGLMIGLQSYTIDYDAVAYRTGVILAEDPGWPVSPPWESYGDLQKSNITRFGLALSKDTPNILSQEKVNRFFCTTFIYPDDYHTRVIFGDYPYGFNISLIDFGGQNRSRGDVLPDGYGTIRRLVKIKGASNATINDAKYSGIANSSYIKTDNVTTHVFSILIDNPRLLGNVTDPAYQIDPAREQITIHIADLKSTITEFPPTIIPALSTITLKNIKVYKRDGELYSNVPLPASEFPYIDGNSTPAMPAPVTDNITLRFSPRFFDLMKAQNSQIYVALGFDVTPASTFLNNTQAVPNFDTLDGSLTFNNPNTTPFNYNYESQNVTQPYLRDAVLEVAIWSGTFTRSGGSLTTPINGSHTIYATAGSGGTISPPGGSGPFSNVPVSVNDGANQTFTIIPNIGYNIASVSVDNVPQGTVTNYTFYNVNQDHTGIVASFTKVPVSIFFDDFDAVTSPFGWTILGIADRFTGTPHYGVAGIRQRDIPSSMTRTISTTGYSDITVSFDMGSKLNNPGRYMRAEWSPDGGTTWNLLKQINNGDPEDDNNLHSFSYPLPASANNNADFALRFVLNANVPGEKSYIDNVLVGGIPY